MQYSTARIEREISATGIEFDRLCKLTDLRGANGKRYCLETVLMIMVMAKLCGEDTPFAIAEWAKNRQEELVQILCLSRPSLPHHNTYRRILAYKVYAEEVERLVGEYNQGGEHGDVYALDGKAVRGMRKKDEEGSEYLLSVYDVEQGKVMLQVEVGRKENEITKAPKALKLVEISQKVVTGDAMHIQRGLAAQMIEAQGDYVLPVKENLPQLYKNIQALFAPEYPKPGFGKIQTDFLTVQKVNKGHTGTCGASAGVVASQHGPSRPAKCSRRIPWRPWRHLSARAPISRAAQWTLLPHLLRSGIWHYQPQTHSSYAFPCIEDPTSSLGHRNRFALPPRFHHERRCYSHDCWKHRKDYGFDQ